MVSRVSVTVPIWLSFIRMELATPFSMPSLRMALLVQNKSSPTNSILLPRVSVSFFQPAQSFSAKPSSMEMMGYCLTQSAQSATSSSLLSDLPLLLSILYLPSSQSSLAAGSRQMLTSAPGLKPALVMASRITSTASSLDLRLGAKPPSSPTPVLYPFLLRTDLRVWKTSTPMRIDSLKEVAPWGAIMNS